jgi:protein-S-isoprenylcysteine O-methyltransferase Ste14
LQSRIAKLLDRAGALFDSFSSRACHISALIVVIGAVLRLTGVKLAVAPDIKLVLFLVFLVIASVFSIGMVIQLFYPKVNIWPPPGKNSWQFWYIWILYPIGVINLAAIAILDSGSIKIDHWFWYLLGFLFLVLGVPLDEWSVRTLDVHQTLGLKGTLLTEGPYRLSRNPQYVAEILIYAGIVLITMSIMSLIIGTILALWFFLAPFSEEPWLEEQFGEQYQEYRENVPRFINWKSFACLKKEERH